jgi:hypothetical protein
MPTSPTITPRFALCSLALAALFAATHAAAEEHFEIREIPTLGRTVAVEIADLDGDRRADLLQIVFEGIPPDQKRWLRIFPSIASRQPPIQIALPEGAAAYDLGDVDGSPGVELVLLRQRDLVVLSLREGTVRERRIELARGSIGPRGEERTIPRFHLVETTPDATWLLAPGFGQLAVLRPDGSRLADLEIGGVATNFVFHSPSLGFAESPVELNYVPARISVGRVDGDSRVDIVAAVRYGVRVFLQRGDGTFQGKPDREIRLSLVSEGDYVRGSGGATATATDVNGDGLADLLVSSVSGGLTDATTNATLHLNRAGRWDLARPDQRLTISDRGSFTLIDLDGDERPELVRLTTPFSAMEIIEAIATQSLDANIAVFRGTADGRFEEKPWASSKLSLPISFETFAPEGFLPTWRADLNGDRHRDLVTSGSGDRLEVYLGGPAHRFEERVARETIGHCGRITSGDFDDDRRTDLVVFDPYRVDEPLKLLRNRGTLPGSPAVLEKP